MFLLNIISFQCLYNDNPICFDIDSYDFLKLETNSIKTEKELKPLFGDRTPMEGQNPGKC